MEHKVSKIEIEELAKIINKIERKCLSYYLGIGLGAFLIVISLIYFLMNPNAVEGILSLIAIGGFVGFINYISLRQAKNRIGQLQKDLDLLQKTYDTQLDF